MAILLPIMLAAASLPPWTYTVKVSDHGRALHVDADLGKEAVLPLIVSDAGTPFVSHIVKGAGGKVSYDFALDKAATTLKSEESAQKFGGVYGTEPSVWLLRPKDAGDGTRRLKIKFETDGTAQFATGMYPDAEKGFYSIEAEFLDNMPFTMFGDIRIFKIPAKVGEVEIVFTKDFKIAASMAEVEKWAVRATRAVEQFYGQYPVKHVLIDVHNRTEDEQGASGVTMGYGGAVIRMGLDAAADVGHLEHDWVLTHEMTHLGMPSVPRQHHWVEEGIATYAEPIGRIRTGEQDARVVFAEMVADMPKGQPEKGDRGLDRTDTWGRTYWGGALFWLVADVRLREKSKGKMGIDDALGGIIKKGNSISEFWPMESLMKATDENSGYTVISDLYREWKDKPVKVDLPALWKKLGVVSKGDTVVFDDKAPLAYVRQAIVAPRKN